MYQVNNVHADIRPDLFIHDLRKYTDEEIEAIIKNDETPLFVCYEDVNSDVLLGYCFAVFEQKHGHSLQPVKTLYLDDIPATQRDEMISSAFDTAVSESYDKAYDEAVKTAKDSEDYKKVLSDAMDEAKKEIDKEIDEKYAEIEERYELNLVVWEGNDSAKAFYEAMGFSVLKYGMEIVL